MVFSSSAQISGIFLDSRGRKQGRGRGRKNIKGIHPDKSKNRQGVLLYTGKSRLRPLN